MVGSKPGCILTIHNFGQSEIRYHRRHGLRAATVTAQHRHPYQKEEDDETRHPVIARAPPDLYFRPASVFAANFLGESNLVAGRLASHNGNPALRLDNGILLTLADNDAIQRYNAHDAVNGMLRPESIRLGNNAPRTPDDVTLTATVRGVRFAGSVTRIDLALGSDVTNDVTDDTTNDITLVAKMLTRSQPVPKPGERIPIRWARQAMLLLPGDAAP